MTDDLGAEEHLRARLRAIDPAASLDTAPLGPAGAAGVARLLEDTMSNDLDTETRRSGTHHRSPLTWLVAAAAAVLIAGVGLFAFLNDDRGVEPMPTATDSVTQPSTREPSTNEPSTNEPSANEPSANEPSVTELGVAAPGVARCMIPDARILAGQTLAFSGTVQDLDDETVLLVPDRFYAGAPTDLVEVRAPSAELRSVIEAVAFEDGERYLVSATDGQVSLCGLSGPATQPLEALYADAFPG